MFNLFKRDVLIGMGIGFILSGIFVSLFGIGQPTDKQIKERAHQLGMVETIDSVKGSSDSREQEQDKPEVRENTQQTPQGNKQKSEQNAQINVQEKNQEKNQEKPPEKPPEANQAKPQAEPQEEKNRKAAFEIMPGMGSETIARRLEEQGIVKDRNAFYKLVTAHKAHSSFRTGRFQLPMGGDMEEVLEILTGR